MSGFIQPHYYRHFSYCSMMPVSTCSLIATTIYPIKRNNGILVFSDSNNCRSRRNECVKGVGRVYKTVSESNRNDWIWSSILFHGPCSKNHTNRHNICCLVWLWHRFSNPCWRFALQTNSRYTCNYWYEFNNFRCSSHSCLF